MDHVIVLYKSKPGTCSHCVDVTNIWDNPPPKSIDGLSISAALKKVNPRVRFVSVVANDTQGNFDVNLTPKDLTKYGVRFPQVILIPGKLWDEAMKNLGPNNDVKLSEGVKVFNYKLFGDKLQYHGQYNIKIPSDYEKWYRSCIEEENDISDIRKKDELLVAIKNNSIFTETNLKNSESKTKKEYTITKFNDVCSFQLVSKK